MAPLHLCEQGFQALPADRTNLVQTKAQVVESGHPEKVWNSLP